MYSTPAIIVLPSCKLFHDVSSETNVLEWIISKRANTSHFLFLSNKSLIILQDSLAKERFSKFVPIITKLEEDDYNNERNIYKKNIENIEWNKIKDSRNIDDFKLYLSAVALST